MKSVNGSCVGSNDLTLIEALSANLGLGRHPLPSNCVIHTMTKEDTSMQFYTQSRKQYCGIDLHARSLYVCILDQDVNVVVHKNTRANPDALMKLITLPRGPRDRCRVHVLLVLARRFLRRPPYRLRPRTCLLHARHPWRRSQER